MLQKIRDNASGFGALLMLGLLILAFAIWGIDFQFGANQPVVKVNGKEVSNGLIANAYNQQIQRFQEFYPNGIPEITQVELKNNVIDTFVRNELLNQHVEEEGYSVSDDMIEVHLPFGAESLHAVSEGTRFDGSPCRFRASRCRLYRKVKPSPQALQTTASYSTLRHQDLC